MSIMNSVQRGHITLVLIALIVSLQANLAAKEVACDAHFWADEGPNSRICEHRYVLKTRLLYCHSNSRGSLQKTACITLTEPDVDYSCKHHSCSAPAKKGRKSWDKFQFGPCHRSGHPKGQVNVKNIFAGITTFPPKTKMVAGGSAITSRTAMETMVLSRGCGTLVIIALIISLQLNHAAATTKVACDVHFWADEGPNPRICEY
ncbi:hypothetical protein PSHT_04442 [Puccinia striiformis]|uniref:Cyanovirin-N domain-containing protein n=1 Tax=Puccinia striiformis TaxID=27350 RepID=A0A2S4WD44_9BASI|nr:hypothetical protein PSHT_04442 [Puccinia striiformis]